MHDFVISPDGFVGWDDGVDMRLEKTARPQAHGSFDLPGYQDARTVAISGSVFADSNARLRHLRSRLTGVLAGGQSGRIQVDRDGDVQWADCRLASKTMFTESGGQEIATFQIQLWCPDPRKFGESRKFTASVGSPVTAFHWGNYQAAPKFVVSGSMPGGYTLWVRGIPFVVTRALTSGAPHTIDYDDGRLRIGGAVIHGGLGATSTPGVLPGVAALVDVTPNTTGTATAAMTLLDTYI
jgi:hypothetical protein